MSEASEELRVKISFDLEKLFYKAWFYKEWAINCKNPKTKIKIIKKALKEIKNVSSEEVRRKIKVEF